MQRFALLSRSVVRRLQFQGAARSLSHGLLAWFAGVPAMATFNELMQVIAPPCFKASSCLLEELGLFAKTRAFMSSLLLANSRPVRALACAEDVLSTQPVPSRL